ncbi:hypothetical protein LG315_13130 [Microbacterium marinum]|uniref:hypothetical protein n=1 Tax=Microbacterium marinum TaxID=421115 RepID=UPI00384E9935
MTRTRTPSAALLVLALAAALAGCTGDRDTPPSGDAAGACAAPIVTVTPARAAPGEEIIVSGSNWGPCDDTSAASDPAWPEATIAWQQDLSEQELGTAAITDGAFTTAVTVPGEAMGGLATLHVRAGEFTLDAGIDITD